MIFKKKKSDKSFNKTRGGDKFLNWTKGNY